MYHPIVRISLVPRHGECTEISNAINAKLLLTETKTVKVLMVGITPLKWRNVGTHSFIH